LLDAVALGGVVVALVVVVAQALQGAERRTFCLPADLRGPGPASCSLVVDRFALILAAVVLVSGVVIVLLSMGELSGRRVPVGEWYFLLLCTLTGAVLLPASRDLIMLLVSLELVSLPVFALTALRRYDGRGAEAAVKLFLVSVVSTAVMLFGISLLYGLTGTVFLDRIAASAGAQSGWFAYGPLSPGDTSPGGAYTSSLQISPDISAAALAAAVILVLAGFAFKIAAVPFHFWAGDVYEGAPIPVAALLSVISKAVGFAGLILILTRALSGEAQLWAPIVAVLAALTMTVGNLLALRQRTAVRLLAWSSVAQSGYILAPLAVWGARGGSGSLADASRAAHVFGEPIPATIAGGAGIDSTVAASLAYLAFYAAMNIGAFSVVMLVSRRSERNELDDYRGLAFRSPGAALSLGFFLICLAGLPPGLAGLFAKVVVFREIVVGGAGWLAVVMAINTVIGLYYYIAWTARLFTPDRVRSSGARAAFVPVGVAIAVALVVAVVFSVAPQTVLSVLPAAAG
jgi:NADH-quinone oxidoreductase subunit N